MGRLGRWEKKFGRRILLRSTTAVSACNATGPWELGCGCACNGPIRGRQVAEVLQEGIVNQVGLRLACAVICVVRDAGRRTASDRARERIATPQRGRCAANTAGGTGS